MSNAMITGSRKLPTSHLTVRVPWHDSKWNGTVCRNPCVNTACTVLPRIGRNKSELRETQDAGQSLHSLPEERLPPCTDEHATFMANFELTLKKEHPYRTSSPSTHGHFEGTSYSVPPYSALAIPFRWMLKEQVVGNPKRKITGKADQYALAYESRREPNLDFAGGDTWIQEGANQLIMLDTFFNAVEPGVSLVFFYAKLTPLSESPRRVIVGVGRVLKIGEPLQYRTSKNRPRDAISGYLWERSLHHSIRPDMKDGFLLPYHELLESFGEDESFDMEPCIAFAPDEAYAQYSFGSEHLDHDNAIASLLECERAIKEIRQHLQGPWVQILSWIDRELNRLWNIRGAYPGLGAALTAFGITHGNLLAWHLASRAPQQELTDPWPQFEQALKDPSELPAYLRDEIGPMLGKKWQGLPTNRKALVKLLSRFVLTNEQAIRWYQADLRKTAGIAVSDAQILANPYVLFEQDRNQASAIAFFTVDRGLFPPAHIKAAAQIPTPSAIGEDIDPRRVRALLVYQLETAADQGHTVLPQGWVIERARALTIQPPCPLDGDVLPIFDNSLAPEVAVTVKGEFRTYQLKRYVEARSCIRSVVRQRRSGGPLPGDHDWEALIANAIPKSSQDEWDESESLARKEKAAALAMLYRSRFSVLMGNAGTGKSTLVKALCNAPGVLQGGILLLAPTGKARVRLEQMSGLAGQGNTIAQFLHSYRRYDPRTGRYFMDSDQGKSLGHKTVVIDESSMLTEDQLSALLDTLQGVDRFVLVGDPKQLPPIGAGRPFVDIINELRPENFESLVPRVAPGYAELLITRRQQSSARRLDLLFANYFDGATADPGKDEIWARLMSEKSQFLEVIAWQTPQQLPAALLEALVRHLSLKGPDDELGFGQSIGGVEHEGHAYFWPQKAATAGAAAAAHRWQVLAAQRVSEIGTDALNRLVQTQFRDGVLRLANQTGPLRRIPKPMGGQRIIWGDKVINVRNSSSRKTWPEKDAPYVANGDIGIVTGNYKTKNGKLFEQLEVEMNSQSGVVYKYRKSEMDGEGSAVPLELAYALTVHKCQGSEFGITFLVIPNFGRSLTRELLYTALTRQQERVVILHQGRLADLHRYSLDSASEIKRRMTNLFALSEPVEIKTGSKRIYLDKQLIYRTERGELVQSKSEWIIADKLTAARIGYLYEQPLMLDGVERWPDFTIRDDNRGITWYWEHLGRMDLEQYRERWARKLKGYENAGIVPLERYKPHVNAGVLLTTVEDGSRGDLSDQVYKTIQTITGE
jgi:hypothetical protein